MEPQLSGTRISFSLNPKDYLQYHLHYMYSKGLSSPRRFLSWFLVPALLILTSLARKGDALTGSLIVSIPVALIWLAGYPSFYVWIIKRAHSRNIQKAYAGTFGLTQHLWIEKEGIKQEDEFAVTLFKVDAIVAITELKDHFLIQMMGAKTVILPKNKISEDDLKNLITDLQSISGLEIESKVNWKYGFFMK